MDIFYLKYRDTLPPLEVELKKPDGEPYDLTNATGVHLHVELFPSMVLFHAEMEIDADPATGIVRYAWSAEDWDTLTVCPGIPRCKGERDHRMEYEVVGPGDARATFPNDTHDSLRITADLGQDT